MYARGDKGVSYKRLIRAVRDMDDRMAEAADLWSQRRRSVSAGESPTNEPLGEQHRSGTQQTLYEPTAASKDGEQGHNYASRQNVGILSAPMPCKETKG